MSAPTKQLGSRRYTDAMAMLGRVRNGIITDTGLNADTTETSLRQIDALLVTLATLKRQKEASEAPAVRLAMSEAEERGTGDEH
jgi:hypothetical protein